MSLRARYGAVLMGTIAVILAVSALIYIAQKKSQLESSISHITLQTSDDLVWGAEQFRIELATAERNVHAYTNTVIPFDPQKLRTAVDVLYSRFQTLSFALKALNTHIVKDGGAALPFDAVRASYEILDDQLNAFINEPSIEKMRPLQDIFDETSRNGAAFAAKVLHTNQRQAHALRGDILDRANDYDVSLTFLMAVSVLFAGLLWGVGWAITSSNRKLHRAVLEAEKSAQAKAQFLSSMSHEFRTPLNAISGYVQLILMRMSPEDRSEISSYESAIEHSIFNLVELVDQILELDSLLHRNESVILDRVDAAALIKNAIKLSARHAISKHITIHQDLGKSGYLLETDSGLFTKVLSTLISNAVKYNHDQGEVWITCEQTPDTITISVEDNGIGIPMDKEKLLFSPFERLGREAGAIGGSGTGLSIARKICSQLGMQMTYHRSRTGGCLFQLFVPRVFDPALRRRVNATTPASPPAPGQETPPPTASGA